MTNENSIRILLTEAAFRQIVDFPYKTAAVSYFCIIKIQLKAVFSPYLILLVPQIFVIKCIKLNDLW